MSDQASSLNVEALYCDHHGWLLGWLRRKLGNSFDAADLAHDTFLRIMAGRAREEESPSLPLRGGAASRDDAFCLGTVRRSGGPAAKIREPRAYLATVAKGVLVNWYQRQALERAYLEALAQLPEPHVPSLEHQRVILETLHQIDAMLDSLPERVRRAFLLSQIEGMRYEDIAGELGCSLISVKRYMKQAFLQCLRLLD